MNDPFFQLNTVHSTFLNDKNIAIMGLCSLKAYEKVEKFILESVKKCVFQDDLWRERSQTTGFPV